MQCAHHSCLASVPKVQGQLCKHGNLQDLTKVSQHCSRLKSPHHCMQVLTAVYLGSSHMASSLFTCLRHPLSNSQARRSSTRNYELHIASALVMLWQDEIFCPYAAVWHLSLLWSCGQYNRPGCTPGLLGGSLKCLHTMYL